MQPLEINVAKLVLIMEVSKHNIVSFLVASTSLWEWHQQMVNMETSQTLRLNQEGYVVRLHSLVKRIPV